MPRPQRQERGVLEQERPGPWPAFLPQPSCCPRGQGAGVGSALHPRGSWTSEGKAQQKGPLLAQDVGWPSQEFGPCRPWGRVGDARCRAVSANPTLLKDHPSSLHLPSRGRAALEPAMGLLLEAGPVAASCHRGRTRSRPWLPVPLCQAPAGAGAGPSWGCGRPACVPSGPWCCALRLGCGVRTEQGAR